MFSLALIVAIVAAEPIAPDEMFEIQASSEWEFSEQEAHRQAEIRLADAIDRQCTNLLGEQPENRDLLRLISACQVTSELREIAKPFGTQYQVRRRLACDRSIIMDWTNSTIEIRQRTRLVQRFAIVAGLAIASLLAMITIQLDRKTRGYRRVEIAIGAIAAAVVLYGAFTAVRDVVLGYAGMA